MLVKALEDAATFLEAARPLLLADEARNCLALGIAGTLRDHPSTFDEHHLWLVEDAGLTVAAALMTPPYNLVLAGPTSRNALVVLAQALDAESVALPGVTGAVPEVEEFTDEWVALTGVARRLRTAQRLHRLTRVLPVAGVPGTAREATRDDRALLVEWVAAFAREVAPEGVPARGAERSVDMRLNDGAGGFTIWEDGGPVSLAGWGGATPNGVRIGPVYTPPESRRHGYGSAVTAALSAERLAAGSRFCFLYTDRRNPTPNRIYARIGYEPVCNSNEYAFDSSRARTPDSSQRLECSE